MYSEYTFLVFLHGKLGDATDSKQFLIVVHPILKRVVLEFRVITYGSIRWDPVLLPSI